MKCCISCQGEGACQIVVVCDGCRTKRRTCVIDVCDYTGVTIEDSIIVVVETDGEKIGVVVDELLGQQQVVIKSLEENYRRVDGISGATILGDGTVALIVDVSSLSKMSGPSLKVSDSSHKAA